MIDMGFRRFLTAGLMAACLLIWAAGRADAACTSPAGNAGDITYAPEHRALQFCNDTAWLPMVRGNVWDKYVPSSIYMDGTDDYYAQTGIPPGVADGKVVTGSVWLKRDATGTIDTIFAINDRFIFRITSAGGFAIVAENTADTDILDLSTSTNPLADTNWHHVIFSIDMANSANNRIYVDGNSIGISYSINLNQDIDFTITGHTFGSDAGGSNKFIGYIADMWVDVGRFVDLTVAANREKFRSSAGLPVFLGPTGARPFGNVPDFFMSGPYETQITNKGTGGGYAAGSGSAFIRSGVPMDIAGPADCPAIGNTCADGSRYAGITPDGKTYMFAAAADLPGDYEWNNDVTTGTYSPLDALNGSCFEDNDLGEGITCITGESNTNFLAQSTDTAAGAPFEAAQACYNLTVHGKSDWYLPSQVELYSLYVNRTAIGGFALSGYWSSSEAHIAGDAQFIDFTSGMPFRANQTVEDSVRCVRKGGCSSPAGIAGAVVYNGDHRVMQWCDGFTWHALGDVDPPGSPTGCNSPTGTGGAVVFNSASKVLQYCDGLAWRDMTGDVQSCGANPTVGQLCPDGSVYVGLSVDGNVRMYTTPADASTSIQWSNANAIDTAQANCTSGAQAVCNTGEANTTYLAALTNADAPYHASVLCQNLVAHGRDDWYVPSYNELLTVYGARNSGALAGTFTTGEYWAGNEYNDIWAIFIPFNTGTPNAGSKFSTPRRLRCVRKD